MLRVDQPIEYSLWVKVVSIFELEVVDCLWNILRNYNERSEPLRPHPQAGARAEIAASPRRQAGQLRRGILQILDAQEEENQEPGESHQCSLQELQNSIILYQYHGHRKEPTAGLQQGCPRASQRGRQGGAPLNNP